VGFRQSSYQVVEGQAVEVCVDMMEGMIGRDITIRLTHLLTPASGRVSQAIEVVLGMNFKLQDQDYNGISFSAFSLNNFTSFGIL